MAILTKTLADVVTGWENGSLIEISWAYKKPAADHVIAGVLVCGASSVDAKFRQEVWDIGA